MTQAVLFQRTLPDTEHILILPDKALPVNALQLASGIDIKNKQPAYMFYLSGCDRQGEEKMGAEMGTILETEIPRFLVELGQTVAASGKDYFAWKAENPDGVEKIAAPYLAE